MNIEKQLRDKHFLELLKGAAEIRRNYALNELQCAQTSSDQIFYCEDYEVWCAVLILLEQRDKLQKYLRLLINDESAPETVQAVKNYLEEIGAEV